MRASSRRTCVARWVLGRIHFIWTGRWLGDKSLCDRFSRLFDLAKNKCVSVTKMSASGLG